MSEDDEEEIEITQEELDELTSISNRFDELSKKIRIHQSAIKDLKKEQNVIKPAMLTHMKTIYKGEPAEIRLAQAGSKIVYKPNNKRMNPLKCDYIEKLIFKIINENLDDYDSKDSAEQAKFISNEIFKPENRGHKITESIVAKELK